MSGFLNSIFEWKFGCHHKNLSRVFTIDHKSTRCVSRAQETAIFVESDVTDKDQRDHGNADAYNSVLTGSEQFAGVNRGRLKFSAQSCVRRRAGARISRQGGTHWNFGSLTMNRTDSSARQLTLESFFKLRNERCFTSLETIASFDTPEKIAA